MSLMSNLCIILAGVRYTDKWKDGAFKWAQDKGFDFVSPGGKSLVFSMPDKPKEVIKLFTKDAAYEHWVKLCTTKLKGNPYVPIFYGKITHPLPDKEVNAIRMEKLTLSHSNKNLEISLALNRYVGNKGKDPYFNKLPAFIANPHTPKGKIIQEKEYKMLKAFYGGMDDSMKEILDELIKVRKTLKYNGDINTGNMAFRGKQLVFLDPLTTVRV